MKFWNHFTNQDFLYVNYIPAFKCLVLPLSLSPPKLHEPNALSPKIGNRAPMASPSPATAPAAVNPAANPVTEPSSSSSNPRVQPSPRHPLFFIINHQVVSIETKFLSLYILCAIFRASFCFSLLLFCLLVITMLDHIMHVCERDTLRFFIRILLLIMFIC